jgi:hypothetical protein
LYISSSKPSSAFDNIKFGIAYSTDFRVALGFSVYDSCVLPTVLSFFFFDFVCFSTIVEPYSNLHLGQGKPRSWLLSGSETLSPLPFSINQIVKYFTVWKIPDRNYLSRLSFLQKKG